MANFKSTGNTEEVMNKMIREVAWNFNNNKSQALYPRARGLNRLMQVWAGAKGDLIDKMRKHPNWDEDALAIVLPHTEARKLDRASAQDALNSMVLFEKIDPTKNLGLWSYIVTESFVFSDTITNEVANRVNKAVVENGVKNVRFGGGQKMTRVMRRLLLEFGFDEKDRDSNILFNNYTNAMSETGTPARFVLSANPNDFLLMSNGNSWSSCHYFGGCYCSGAVSYMGDDVTLVGYTIPANENVPYSMKDWPLWKLPKRTRQLFMVSDYAILQSRIYPGGNDNLREEYAQYVTGIYEKTFATEGERINWHYQRDIGNIETFFRSQRGATHYPDWSHGYNCRIILKKDWTSPPSGPKYIGSEPVCMVCGERHSNCGYHACSSEHINELRRPGPDTSSVVYAYSTAGTSETITGRVSIYAMA